jgi:prepilin-type N-terminal cleavage/methylation domain-containing protein
MLFLYNKNKSKGYSLIELLVVITILGILISITQIFYLSYVNKSYLTHDKTNVNLFNKLLNLYTINNEISKERVISSDIRDIISQEYGKELDFSPKSKEYHYFYDINDNEVILMKTSDIKKLDLDDQPNQWAISYKPESIYYPYLLLDEKGDAFVEIVNSFYDESNYYDFNTVASKLDLLDEYEKNYFMEVLSRNAFIGLTSVYNYNDDVKENIIVAKNVTSINSNNTTNINISKLYFPHYVKDVEDNCFNNSKDIKLVSFNSYINNILDNKFINSSVTYTGGLIINKNIYIYGRTNDSSNPFTHGDGTEEDPYQINNIDQLLAINNYSNKYFKLMNDIDISNINKIEGTFNNFLDGNNYALLNYHYEISNTSNYGLFNENGNNGVIINLSFKNVYININNNINTNDLVLGVLTPINNGIVDNVTISGNIDIASNYSSNTYVGGICGKNYGSISKTKNEVIINIDSSSNKNYVGGITGYNNGNILYSVNSTSITVKGANINVGGIAGYTESLEKNITLKGLLNRGNVKPLSGSSGYVGGLFGYTKGSKSNNILIEDSATMNLNTTTSYNNVAYGNVIGNGVNTTLSNLFFTYYSYTSYPSIGFMMQYNIINNTSNPSKPNISSINELNSNCDKILMIDPFRLSDSVIYLYFE